MTLSKGTRLGPYQVERLLGTGGMGEVYRARDTTLNRDVAIKVLLPAVTAVLLGRVGYVGVMGSRRHTPGFVARLREAGVDVGRLRSPTGLDLGARRPPEIALSILAEVMTVTRGRPGGSLDIVGVGAEKGPE